MSTSADFLDWICDKYRITSEGTSWEYFRQYLQLYTDINGQYMDKNDCRAIKNVYRPCLYRSLPPSCVVVSR